MSAILTAAPARDFLCPLGECLVRLVALHSHKCLDVNRQSLDPGGELIQYFCKSDLSTNQYFSLERDSEGFLSIRNKNSGLCLSGYPGKDGSEILLRQAFCDGSDLQKFEALEKEGAYSLRIKSTRRCVDVAGASRADGASVVQYYCAEAMHQRFFITPKL